MSPVTLLRWRVELMCRSVSSLTPLGQHGASAPLCFSRVLLTNTLEVAVVDEGGTFESSDDSHSGPEE